MKRNDSPASRHILEAVITSLLPGVHVDPYDRTARNPVNFFLDHVRDHLGLDFDFYLVNASSPEQFTLTQFNPPCVVYDVAHTALMAAGLPVPMEQELEQRFWRNLFLRLVSDFLVPLHRPELAFLALDLAARDGLQLAYEHKLMDLEMADYDEMYIASWFFGLAHELGHLVQQKQGLVIVNDYGFVSVEAIAEIGNELIRRTADLPPQWVTDSSGKATVLNATSVGLSVEDAETLLPEVLADISAIEMLWGFCEPFARSVGRDPNWSYLSRSILMSFPMLRFIASAKFVAAFIASPANLDIRAARAREGMGVRFCVIANVLARLSGSEEYPDPNVLEFGFAIDQHHSQRMYPGVAEAQILGWNLAQSGNDVGEVVNEILKMRASEDAVENLFWYVQMTRLKTMCSRHGLDFAERLP